MPFVGIKEGIFLIGFFTAVLSSVSLSVLPEMCFDLRFRRCDFRLGFASFALSESLSLLDEVDVDEPVEVDDADETAADVFFVSDFGFSTAIFGFGGAAPGRGYFLGRPRPRPVVVAAAFFTVDVFFVSFSFCFAGSSSPEFEPGPESSSFTIDLKPSDFVVFFFPTPVFRDSSSELSEPEGPESSSNVFLT